MSTMTDVTTFADKKRLAEFLDRAERAHEAVRGLLDARVEAAKALQLLARDADHVVSDVGVARVAIFYPIQREAEELAEFIERDGAGSMFKFDSVAASVTDVMDLVVSAIRNTTEKLECETS